MSNSEKTQLPSKERGIRNCGYDPTCVGWVIRDGDEHIATFRREVDADEYVRLLMAYVNAPETPVHPCDDGLRAMQCPGCHGKGCDYCNEGMQLRPAPETCPAHVGAKHPGCPMCYPRLTVPELNAQYERIIGDAQETGATSSADHYQRTGSPTCECGHRKVSHDAAGCCGICSCVQWRDSQETGVDQPLEFWKSEAIGANTIIRELRSRIKRAKAALARAPEETAAHRCRFCELPVGHEGPHARSISNVMNAQKANAARQWRVLKGDYAGQLVYAGHDPHGCAKYDTRNTGVEHTACSLNESGEPFFTVPKQDLEEVTTANGNPQS